MVLKVKSCVDLIFIGKILYLKLKLVPSDNLLQSKKKIKKRYIAEFPLHDYNLMKRNKRATSTITGLVLGEI